MLELGGNIQLSGFSDLEPAKLIVVKKMVGNHVKRLDTLNQKMSLLHLTLKHVHSSNQFEISGKLDLDGKIQQSESTDYNLFFAINKVLKGLEPKE